MNYGTWSLNYSFIYTGERYEAGANIAENYALSWYTSDLSLSKIFNLKCSQLRAAVEVNNLLNQQYEVVQCYPMPRDKCKNNFQLDAMIRLPNIRLCAVVITMVVLLFSCRKEEQIVPSTSTTVTGGESGEICGFFLLNEGNMGSNKSTLDYFDYQTGIYTKNIYAERNPGVVKELGDVGNDIQIYGNKLYAVVNCSHFVEVMDVRTARHITQISIPNCRYLVFKGRYAT